MLFNHVPSPENLTVCRPTETMLTCSSCSRMAANDAAELLSSRHSGAGKPVLEPVAPELCSMTAGCQYTLAIYGTSTTMKSVHRTHMPSILWASPQGQRMSLLVQISRLLSPVDQLPSLSKPSDSLVFFTQEHAYSHVTQNPPQPALFPQTPSTIIHPETWLPPSSTALAK